MSLAKLRARVRAAECSVQTHAADTRSIGARLHRRLQRAWPWLWLGSGATLGIIAEQRMVMPSARPRSGRANNANDRPSAPPSLLASLPWGLILGWVDRALTLAEERHPDRSQQHLVDSQVPPAEPGGLAI